MFWPWHNWTMLALESQEVIALRLLKLFRGGPDAYPEARHMIVEKLDAAAHAALEAMSGHSPDVILLTYRAAVRASALRLSH